MSVVSNRTGGARRASLAVAFAAGVALLAAPVGAAVVVSPWAGAATAEVAPTDAPGFNVVERAEVSSPRAGVSKAESVEESVGAWHPTTKNPPKGSPKG